MRKFIAAATVIGAALSLAACDPAEEAAEAPVEPVVEAPVADVAPASEAEMPAMDGMEHDGMAGDAPVEDDERGNPVDQAS